MGLPLTAQFNCASISCLTGDYRIVPHFHFSINQLSRDLSVPPNRISEIVNGKRSITADTALRFQRYFGVEAQFWLNLQTEYDLRMIKREIWPVIEQRIIPIKKTETGIEQSTGA